MFIQPCFIKKITPELKKELKALGYKDYGKVRFYDIRFKKAHAL